MGDRRTAEEMLAADAVVLARLREGWVSTAELAALTRRSVQTLRRQLARLGETHLIEKRKRRTELRIVPRDAEFLAGMMLASVAGIEDNERHSLVAAARLVVASCMHAALTQETPLQAE